MTNQIYEPYWQFTMAYTDVFGANFRNSLRAIVDFIDINKSEAYSSAKYLRLQTQLKKKLGLAEASVRKVINEYVKLGFISTHLVDYHPEAKSFLAATDDATRKFIFSKVVYANSSFDRSVDTDSQQRHIGFLIKTLYAVRKLDKLDLLALLLTDLSEYPKGYLTKTQLDERREHVRAIGFESRKYNQLSHLRSILGHLDNLKIVNNIVYLIDDAPEETPPEAGGDKRDPYLQGIFKDELAAESLRVLGHRRCMVENLAYPQLIASHIKPWRQSEKEEAFDVNNGLLLSRNLDSLFDLKYISFDENGSIIASTKLAPEVVKHLKQYSLPKRFLNKKRIDYLKYHRSLLK